MILLVTSLANSCKLSSMPILVNMCKEQNESESVATLGRQIIMNTKGITNKLKRVLLSSIELTVTFLAHITLKRKTKLNK